MNKKISIVLLCSLLALSFGCNQVALDSSGDISFNEFLEKNKITKHDNFYLYQGDIALTEEDARNLYNESLLDTTETRGNVAIYSPGNWRLWSSAQINSLTYSFTSSMATAQFVDVDVRNAFRECIRRWMAVGDFTATEVSSGGTISVYAVTDPNNIGSAWAYYPNSFVQEIVLNRYWVDTQIDTYEKMVGIFTHEFGHTLGLAHEHQRADSPDQFGQGTTGEAVGDYDTFSIMSYANSPFVSGISLGDTYMLKIMYPPSAPVITSGTVTMVSLTNQSFVCAEDAGASPLIANRTGAGSWERFQIINLGNGKCAIKSAINGKYVCAENAGSSSLIANRTAVGLWETFTLVHVGWDLYALQADANSQYVCADSKGADPLIANRSAIGWWEIFRIRLV